MLLIIFFYYLLLLLLLMLLLLLLLSLLLLCTSIFSVSAQFSFYRGRQKSFLYQVNAIIQAHSFYLKLY